jgi:hypothetical protein
MICFDRAQAQATPRFRLRPRERHVRLSLLRSLVLHLASKNLLYNRIASSALQPVRGIQKT